MKLVLIFIFASQILAGNNTSEHEFVINEEEKTSEEFPVLVPVEESPKNVTQNKQKVIKTQSNYEQNNNKETLQRLDNTQLQNLDVAIPSQARETRIPAQKSNNQEMRSQKSELQSIEQTASEFPVQVNQGRRGLDGQDAQTRVNRSNENRQPKRRNNGQMAQNNAETLQTIEKESVSLQPLNEQNVDAGQPSGPRFISFGMDKAVDLQYQNLLAKILNFGMLSMFTDLTDQATKIELMLVLKQDRQIAGKEIYKVIFAVNNPKYVTGKIFYGTEFAVTAGVLDPNPNEIDFISFGKSVILGNLLGLLSIKQSMVENRASLAHVNETRNKENLDFNSQSKSAMVEFIQTILALAQSETKQKAQKEECNEPQEVVKKEEDSTLIGSGVSLDYTFDGRL